LEEKSVVVDSFLIILFSHCSECKKNLEKLLKKKKKKKKKIKKKIKKKKKKKKGT